MNTLSVEAVAREADRLPVFPASVARLLARLRDPDVTPLDIEEALRPDPVLTARLLKLANSSYYRPSSRVATLRDAAVRLGLRPVFALASGSALAQVLPRELAGYDIDAKSFMSHCAAVAVFSEAVARRCAPELLPMAFTAGLLHDLGKLVVSVFLSRERQGLLERLDGQRLAVVEAEAAILGVDHAEVGEMVCARWNLPPQIALAARYHHAPGSAPTPEARRLSQVVQVADALAHLLGFSTDAGELNRRLDMEVARALGLDGEALEHLAAEAVEPAMQMSVMLTGA